MISTTIAVAPPLVSHTGLPCAPETRDAGGAFVFRAWRAEGPAAGGPTHAPRLAQHVAGPSHFDQPEKENF